MSAKRSRTLLRKEFKSVYPYFIGLAPGANKEGSVTGLTEGIWDAYNNSAIPPAVPDSIQILLDNFDRNNDGEIDDEDNGGDDICPGPGNGPAQGVALCPDVFKLTNAIVELDSLGVSFATTETSALAEAGNNNERQPISGIFDCIDMVLMMQNP